MADLKSPGRKLLEVTCGDGMVGTLLAGYGHEMQLTDLEDWRDDRAPGMAFETSDVSKRLPFPSDHYDLVYSYNAFEDFPDPAAAFFEILRVCRPGGLMYFAFGPLYASPWGLHADRLIMPYPQFLFSIEFVLERLGSGSL